MNWDAALVLLWHGLTKTALERVINLVFLASKKCVSLDSCDLSASSVAWYPATI